MVQPFHYNFTEHLVRWARKGNPKISSNGNGTSHFSINTPAGNVTVNPWVIRYPGFYDNICHAIR